MIQVMMKLSAYRCPVNIKLPEGYTPPNLGNFKQFNTSKQIRLEVRNNSWFYFYNASPRKVYNLKHCLNTHGLGALLCCYGMCLRTNYAKY